MLLGLVELENFHSCKMCVRLFSRSQWSWGLKFAFALIFDMILNKCEKCQNILFSFLITYDIIYLRYFLSF